MAKKKFTDKKCPEIIYETIDEKWLDENTYIIVFADMKDVDGDTYYLEVEFHKDENRVTYTRVYDHENVDAYALVSRCFREQFEQYILQQVGVLREDSFFHKEQIKIELELDIPKGSTIQDLREFIYSLKFEGVHTMTPKDEKIKLLSIKSMCTPSYYKREK